MRAQFTKHDFADVMIGIHLVQQSVAVCGCAGCHQNGASAWMNVQLFVFTSENIYKERKETVYTKDLHFEF